MKLNILIDFGFITHISKVRLQVNASLNKLWINYLRCNLPACANPEGGLVVRTPPSPPLPLEFHAIISLSTGYRFSWKF